MQALSRRGFLTTASALSAAAPGLLPIAASRAAQAAEPTTGIWAAGAKPDIALSIGRHEMAPFGAPIETLLAGGTWPGKAIRYKKGDQFRVLVENRLDAPTSLHWHGLIVPSLEDGVPVVSQAPILPGAALYYAFPLQQAGTYWYHSHFGLQEQQGLSGPLIIEDAAEPHDYDEDLVVSLSDVVAGPVERVVPGLRDGSLQVKVALPYRLPDGAPFPIDVPYAGYLLNGKPPADPWTQTLRPGSRARLRLINASGSSYFRIALDGVPLEVIARDGEAVVPVTVDDLVLGTAERCDVIVSLPESGSYTLRAAVLGDDRQALGVLHTPDARPRVDDRRATFEGRTLQAVDLRAPGSTALPDAPRQTFAVTLSGDMKGYRWLMNGNAWPEPYASHAGDDAKESWYRVRPGDGVRFDLVNQTPMAHPMHLHGHVFRVLENGQDRPDAPLMDTVTVWPKGRVSIELLANNPGRWFFHCHNVWHLATGMAQAVSYHAATQS
jgi:multicopper oxidase